MTGTFTRMLMAACWCVLPAGMRAETGTTNIIEAQYINHGGQYVVGETGSDNLLWVRNEGWLENTAGIIGYEPGADRNLALVTGTRSLWESRGALRIGVAGRENSLIVSNNGAINAWQGMIGVDESGVGNSVIVTDGGRWNTGSLELGIGGSSNSFSILRGGVVGTGGPADAVGYTGTSQGNRMTIHGTGSGLFGNFFSVGQFGSSFNQLTLSGGGQVSALVCAVGDGWNNSIMIRDPGSVWNAGARFYVGYDGTNNLLTIRDGGRVASEGAIVSGVNNRALVQGTNSIWETGGDTGQLVVGDIGSNNEVSIENGARLNTWAAFIGGVSNRVAVTGPGSLWQNSTDLMVGEDFAGGSTVVISNRARVNSSSVLMAAVAGVLDLNNATLSILNELSVGGEIGRANELRVLNGSTVTNVSGYIGGTTSALLSGINDSNWGTVAGSGSVWMNLSNLTIGVTGARSGLTIANGGRVINGTAYLGYYGYSPDNQVVLNGSGTLWDNRGPVYVGYAASGNAVTVSNGAAVQSLDVFLGRQSNRTNAIRVTGTGSRWDVAGVMSVGNTGQGNRLTIADGGLVQSSSGVIDSASGGRSNSVVVRGTGARWVVNGPLAIGASAGLNTLSIENQGIVTASGLSLGNSISLSNTLEIAGGKLFVTNAAHTATLSLGRSYIWMDDGELIANQFVSSSGMDPAWDIRGGMAWVGSVDMHSGRITIGGSPTEGSLYLTGATHRIGGGLILATNGYANIRGTLTSALTNRGELEIGTNASRLTLNGAYVQGAAGSTLFELGGAQPQTGHDVITVNGTAVLGGVLRLRLANGYMPLSNTVLTIMTWSNSSGTFANAAHGSRITLEGSGVSCTVHYSSTNLQLRNFGNVGPSGTNDIDEGWAQQYFGHYPLTDEERRSDADGDGMTNEEEYWAGTSPLDGLSVLRILSTDRNGQGLVTLQFSTTTNRTYGVAYSSDLETWQEVATPSFAPIGNSRFEWTDSTVPTEARRFYRIYVR